MHALPAELPLCPACRQTWACGQEPEHVVDGIRVKINRAGPRPDYQGDERQVRQYLTCGSDMYSPPCLLHVLHLQLPIHLSVSGV